MDWRNYFLQPDWMARIDRLAERRFGAGGLAEEASTFVIEAIQADDWKRCRGYQGKASKSTFLITLINNALEEFSRKRFGRPRPPMWLKREGPLWVDVWKRICLERQSDDAVIDRLTADGQRESTQVQRIVSTVKSRMPWCGHSNQEIPLQYFQGDDGDTTSQEDNLMANGEPSEGDPRHQYELLLMSLTYLLKTPEDATARASQEDPVSAMLASWLPCFERCRQSLALSDEERLLLRMIYQEGCKKNEVARTLGVPAHQPGRMLKRVLERIALTMRKEGLDIEVLCKTLNEMATCDSRDLI